MMIKYLPPKGEFEGFHDSEHYKQKLKEWGLSTVKEEFWYKERDFQEQVTLKGYEVYGNANEFNTLVVEFRNGKQTCIHPAFLKEMQQSSFGKESIWHEGNLSNPESSEKPTEEVKNETPPKAAESETKKTGIKKAKKEKENKIVLPAEKVHFTAKVKQFSMTYNSFTEENDEVIILENVELQLDPPIHLDYAWCSHSKTLKKLELAIGEGLEFDGKITAKKLTKGKDSPPEYNFDAAVPYKINNPSKLTKLI